ncbi:MAG TPA: penicillin acylase family protein, partial [Gemmatimonadaceae bacterium]
NPASGWAYNSNNWPWTTSGPSSPKRENFPKYVESGGENARGLHAVRILSNRKDFTRDGLLAAAWDSYQPGFEKIIPDVVKAYDAAPASDLKAKLSGPVELLRGWDLRWSVSSVPTSLAVFYADELGRALRPRGGRGAAADAPVNPADTSASRATDSLRLAVLNKAVDKLMADFGKWQTPWGDINRFQRVNDQIVATFDDNAPSIPVMFTSARWGSLASFGARQYENTKKWYGTSGNSFLAIIEFGKDSVRARAVTAGGESGDPASKHFNDQAERYATGNFRTVYYYRNQLKGHTEREYHPGQ